MDHEMRQNYLAEDKRRWSSISSRSHLSFRRRNVCDDNDSCRWFMADLVHICDIGSSEDIGAFIDFDDDSNQRQETNHRWFVDFCFSWSRPFMEVTPL